MFKCPLCAKGLSSRSNLERHTLSHTKEKPHKCHICPAAFGESSHLKTHIKCVHDGVKIMNKKNFKCHACSYKCSTSRRLKQHVQKHSQERPFSCSIQGCTFKTRCEGSVGQHLRRVHSNERPYECPSDGCNYRGKYTSDLATHLKTHSTEKPLACQVPGCSYRTKTKQCLTVHIKGFHSKEKLLNSSFCDFRTKHTSAFKVHQDIHLKNRRYKCAAQNCKFASYRKQQLELHISREHIEQNVICNAAGCSYRCGSIAVLQRHCRKRHQRPIIQCPGESCKFSTQVRSKLLSHISSRHGDLQTETHVLPTPTYSDAAEPTEAVKVITCDFPNCDYQTEFPHRFDRHVTSHGKEEKRTFVCTFCSAKFSTIGCLNTHVQRHIREKPNCCSYCNYRATDGSGLRRHAERRHHIHVIPRGKQDQYDGICCTCSKICSSYSELVLHSMTHLRPVVVLERLRVYVR